MDQYPNLNEMMKSSAVVCPIDEAPDEKHSCWVHFGNSLQTDSLAEYDSEADDELGERHEEFQHLVEKPTENRTHKIRRPGVFSQLRRRLTLRSPQVVPLPAARSSSSARSEDALEMVRDNPIMVQKTRLSCYRCVPNPPGCIPTEAMMKVLAAEEETQACHPLNRSGLMAEIPTHIDGNKNTQKGNQQDRNRPRSVNIPENSVLPSNVQNGEHSIPTVLRDNWVDSEF
ncbi:hypothetical protein OS493_027900 [Desmophyllum pertusum]|uniref:Uncharacterized protein n=1 Tax=Desmophyllum pertusum TaxID=174260 RepID=A0A9W9YKU6_9CNID|nr:hypothetical protein OS493_027900 [Desmophyllum pertusum]